MTPAGVRAALGRALSVRIVRYFLIGLVTASFDLAFYLLLVNGLGFDYFRTGAAGFVLTTLLNYELGLRFVFTEPGHARSVDSLLKVFAVSTAGLVLHQLCLASGVEVLGLGTTTAKLLAVGIVFFWNYFARTRLVFRPA